MTRPFFTTNLCPVSDKNLFIVRKSREPALYASTYNLNLAFKNDILYLQWLITISTQHHIIVILMCQHLCVGLFVMFLIGDWIGIMILGARAFFIYSWLMNAHFGNQFLKSHKSCRGCPGFWSAELSPALCASLEQSASDLSSKHG